MTEDGKAHFSANERQRTERVRPGPTLLVSDFGTALPPDFGLQILVAIMAPIGESAYFPPLDRCFTGEHQLLSVWNASLSKARANQSTGPGRPHTLGFLS